MVGENRNKKTMLGFEGCKTVGNPPTLRCSNGLYCTEMPLLVALLLNFRTIGEEVGKRCKAITHDEVGVKQNLAAEVICESRKLKTEAKAFYYTDTLDRMC